MQPTSSTPTSSDADALQRRVTELEAERDSLRERLARVGTNADAASACHAVGMRTSRTDVTAVREQTAQARLDAAEANVGHAHDMQAREAELATSEASNTALLDANASLETTLAMLHASEVRLQMVLESATDYAIVTMDLGGTITGWNSGAEQVLGWTGAEALGQNAGLFFTPEDRAAGMPGEEMRTALDQGRADDERWHVKRDGERFWANGTMMQVRDLDGVAVGYLKILRDQTRQHEAEQALRRSEAALAQSEAQFRATFEQVAVSIAHIGLDGRWLRVNGRLCAMLGYTEAELLERTFRDITYPDDLETDLEKVRQLLAGEIANYSVEKRHLRKDGAILWSYLTVSLARDLAGAPQYFIAVAQDIMPRKKAEAELAESEARFRALADNIPQLAWMARQDGWIFWYNRRWHEYCGTTPAQMEGWGWQVVHHPDHLERVTAHFRERVEAGEPWEDIFPLRSGDGGYRWFLSRAEPIRDEQGRIQLWFGTNTDVTESRQAEAANARLAAIVASSDDAIISFAAEDGRILTWNGGAERLFGYTEAEAVGGPVSLIVPPDLPEGEPTGVFAWAMAGHPVVAHETMRLTKAGERVPVSITATRMLTPDRRITGVSGIFHDLRPRVRAEAALRESEAQLRQAQKLEAIGRLAAGVAHDFNNILQGMVGGLELVLDEVEPTSPAHEFAELALGSASRGSSLTHHLLSYARKQMLRPQAVELAPLLANMRKLLARTLGPHIAVEALVDRATPPVQVDPGQLETALLNLAINASHAMPKGGTLSLEAHEDSQDRGRIIIAVTDTGMGMDEATLAQAFEPFFTTKGLDGTGLGLSMVQGFAEQSGGKVSIASAPGTGTTVQLRLPAAVIAADSTREQQATSVKLQGSGRILLVDDVSDVLVTAGAFLEKAGFQVVRASSGDQALALLASGEHFDAVVSDYAMPGLNGLDLVEQVRAVQPGLPALIITGFAEVGGTETLPEAVAILRKPFQRRQLVEAVLQTVSRQQRLVGQEAGSGEGRVLPDTVLRTA